jgi:hypothetical protein
MASLVTPTQVVATHAGHKRVLEELNVSRPSRFRRDFTHGNEDRESLEIASQPTRVLDTLNRHGVEYILIGGLAATLRGSNVGI